MQKIAISRRRWSESLASIFVWILAPLLSLRITKEDVARSLSCLDLSEDLFERNRVESSAKVVDRRQLSL